MSVLLLGCGLDGSWTPAQLTELAAWYEAGPEYCWQDVGCTIACGDGDPIYTWLDRSGNGYHLTQSDILKRPTLRLVNGEWCVRSDGVNDFIQSSIPLLTYPAGVWVVGLCNDDAGGPYVDNTSGWGRHIQRMTSTSLRVYSGTIADVTISGTLGNKNLVVVNYDGAGSVLAFNGTEYVINPGSTESAGLTVMAQGSGSPSFLGDINEVGVCSAGLVVADREKLLAYSRANWGTP